MGAGLLVERAGGIRLPGALIAPLGFATLVGATQVTTFRPGLAPATVPVVVVLAIAGFVAGRDRLRAGRPDRWTVAMALVVYGVYAAPALLLFHRTFLGYGNLGDASIHFAIVDRLVSHGKDISDLAPSSYSASLGSYFATAYPTGAHGVLASVRALLGVDVAWVFQPFLTVLAVLIALGLHPLAAELTGDRRLAAGAAGVAALAGLVYGYAVDQEAIKEMGGLAMLVLVAGLAPSVLRAPPGWRAAIPPAVASAGALGVMSLAIAPWLGLLLLAVAIALVVRHARRRPVPLLLELAAFAVLGLLLAIPTLDTVSAFVHVNNQVLTGNQELGNLQRPLDFLQAFGVWPVSDFRTGVAPTGGLAVALTGAALLAAVLGAVAVVRRRAWGVALFAAVSLIGFAVVSRDASPWAYGKVLMLISPALVLVAAAGAAGLWERHARVEGAVLLTALLAGVLWTNAMTYHHVDSAPESRLGELERIGERYAGEGPAVFVEFDEYAKHFLRETDPTSVAEAWRPAWPVTDAGAGIRFGFSSDIGDFWPASLTEHFKLAVLRQGPTQSRPPAGWDRVFHGRYYDVWHRRDDAPRVLSQLRLGSRLDAGAQPSCASLERLAGSAIDAGAQLAYAPRQPVRPFRTTSFGAPTNWAVDAGDGETFRPVGPGRVSGSVVVPAGTYGIWFEASVGRRAAVRIDGRVVGALEHQLNPRLSTTRIATVKLSAGEHDVAVEVEGGDLEPGNGGGNRLIGPVYFASADPSDMPVRTVAPERWRSLCGQHLDWVQVVAP